MEIALGKKITEYRKEKGITQEELSEKLGISPQAVSKWENGNSYPDILLLPKLADIFEVTVDELLSHSPKQDRVMLLEGSGKPLDEMVLRVIVHSANGDKVRVNLPLPLLKLGLEIGMRMPQISGNEALKDMNFAELFQLVERGVVGKIVEIEEKEGDRVEILVE